MAETVDLSAYLPPQIKGFDAETEVKINEFKNDPQAQVYLLPKHDKFFIARYLRARKYDVGNAVQMFVNMMKWRQEKEVDTIRETFPNNVHYETLVNYWPGSHNWDNLPTTYDGSLVLLQALGRTDLSLIDVIGSDTLLQFHIWCMEGLENRYWATVASLGYWPGFVMIEDFEGVGFHTFSSAGLKVMQEIIKINQNYYPEMLRKMYIINVPSVFYMFWKGIQLWMEPRSIAKMDLIGGNALSVAPQLTAILDLSMLPPRLGGTGTRDIPKGGLIGAPSMKFREKTKNKVDVAPGTKHEVTYIFNEGDIISWEFKTKDWDIGFTIIYVGTSDCKQNQIIKSYERVDAFKMVIRDAYTAFKSGNYLFQWDNVFSWTRWKALRYNVYKGTELI